MLDNHLENFVQENIREKEIIEPEKIKCIFCDEIITKTNISRHIKNVHIYCKYCKKIHNTNFLSLEEECPMFNFILSKLYRRIVVQ